MQVLATLDMRGNMIQSMSLENLTEFPAVPRIGSLNMIQKRLMLCIDLGSNAQDPVPFWLPMSSEVQMFKFNQPVAATNWIVEHNLNNPTPVFQVYDADGEIFTPNAVVIVDANTLSIEVLTPMQGSVTVLSGTMFGTPAMSPVIKQEFGVATSWSLTHNLGRVPVVRVYVNGAEVQASVSATDTRVTVDFGTNSVAGSLLLF